MKSTKRNTFTLDTAIIKLQTVLEERDDDYGSSNDFFDDLADMCNVILGRKLSEKLNSSDAANIMLCMKLIRISQNPSHEDSWIDTAGYALLGLLKQEELCENED